MTFRKCLPIAATLSLISGAALAEEIDLCSVSAEAFRADIATLFEGTWQVEYLPGTFTVAGMTNAVPVTPPDQFEFQVTDGVLSATGGEAFGGFDFEWMNEATGLGEMRYDEALDLFTPVDCGASVPPALFARGEMTTPDGTLRMDVFFNVESLSRMPGAIIGDVERAIFIHRPIVATRLSPVPDVPTDLLPIGDGSPGSTAPKGDDLLPIGDGSPGSTSAKDELLPVE